MPGPVALPQTDVYDLHSRHADADYRLWVATPVAGWRPVPPPPRGVLYVLDANLFFGTAVEMTRLMHQLYGELPPPMVVGTAYDTAVPLSVQTSAKPNPPRTDRARTSSSRLRRTISQRHKPL
jgi:predicted alpha/beta superfamily hydrolase